MSTTRLTFLYPTLFRSSIRFSEASILALRVPRTRYRCLNTIASGRRRKVVTTGGRRDFSAATIGGRRKSAGFAKRHGKAVEPLVREDEGEDVEEKEGEDGGEEGDGEGLRVFASTEEKKDGGNVEKEKGKGKGNETTGKDTKSLEEKQKTKTKATDKSTPEKDREDTVKEKEKQTEASSAAPLSEETQAAARIPGDEYKTEEECIAAIDSEKSTSSTSGTSPSTSSKDIDTPSPTTDKKAPLETILHMPPPESAEAQNASKPLHLQTPPYVHHFDTYTLVQQVEGGGFTTDQSITAMKAVRSLLAVNLDVAKEGLVSKSDVENETYLFRAACSELKTEIENTRKAHEETMRRERTLLQHEVDILNQKLTQELLTLKDDLKGMFDDRKMAVRQEQRTMESAIQELNYQITVSLNSDSKSEVEGLRWVLTRRSVMGILFMALMVLASLRYASYKSHEDEVKKKKEASAGKGEGGGNVVEDLPAQGAAEILAAN